MLIKSLDLQDFGVYAGHHQFDLTPKGEEGRNIVVIRGKNGSGKSTVFEALMLGFLGSLSLDDRVRKQDYLTYLQSRIHVKRKNLHLTDHTSVKVDFNYFLMGQPTLFSAYRKWSMLSGKVFSEFELKENGVSRSQFEEKELEQYLRQVISPGLAKVIFFDGERLQQLNTDAQLNDFVAESCKAVFGTQMTELLQQDLRHYVLKLNKEGASNEEVAKVEALQRSLSELHSEIEQALSEKSSLLDDLQVWEVDKVRIEEEISSHGIWHNSSVKKLEEAVSRAQADRDHIGRRIGDLAAGLAPFALAKTWLSRLRNRIELEWESERTAVAKDLLEDRLKKIDLDSLLGSTGFNTTSEKSRALREALAKALGLQGDAYGTIIHPLSAEERKQLLGKIAVSAEEAKVATSLSFDFERAEAALRDAKTSRENIASEESVSPLLQEYNQTISTLASIHTEVAVLDRKLVELGAKAGQVEQSIASARKRAEEKAELNSKLELAIKTQQALADYSKELLSAKLRELGKSLVRKFNHLCRKPDYIDTAIIDQHTYQVQLVKSGSLIHEQYLSAGERQLLGISILWALREMTRMALPLVIDTPMGRLDSSHRKAMLESFLPQASHQVVILATDEELNNEALSILGPNTARHFEIAFAPEAESSSAETVIPNERQLTRR